MDQYHKSNKKKSSTHKWIRGSIVIVLIALSIITGALLAFDANQPDIYRHLYLLPIMYIFVIVLYLFLVPNEYDKNIGVLFFVLFSIARCLISPLFMYLGNYTSLFRNISDKYEMFGSLLLIYEQVACIVAIHIVSSYRIVFGHSRRRISGLNGRVSIRGFHPKNGGLGWILTGIGVLLAIMWFAFPSIPRNYTSALDMLSSGQKFVAADYTYQLAIGTAGRSFTTLFLVLFKSFRIIGPAYLITKIHEKNDGNFGMLVSILIISLQFLFIPDTIANALIVVCILFILMLQLYGRQRNLLMLFMISVLAVGIVAVLLIMYQTAKVWFGLSNVNQYIAQTLQSYLTGVDNIASTFLMPEKSKLVILGNTLFSAVPFQSTLFGITETLEDLNDIYTSLSGLSGQIISTIGGGYYLFGVLFAPLFSVLFVIVSTKYGIKYRNTTENWKKISYIYICVQTALGLGVYNIQITLGNLLQVGFPLMLVAWYLDQNIKEVSGND